MDDREKEFWYEQGKEDGKGEAYRKMLEDWGKPHEEPEGVKQIRKELKKGFTGKATSLLVGTIEILLVAGFAIGIIAALMGL